MRSERNGRWATVRVSWMLLASCLWAAGAQAQDVAVKSSVSRFFDAMANHDTTTMRSLVFAGATISSTGVDSAGKAVVRVRSLDEMIRGVGSAPQTWVEKLGPPTVQITGATAQYAADYRFLINGSQKFCGRTTVQLAKDGNAWKLSSITESQLTAGCAVVP